MQPKPTGPGVAAFLLALAAIMAPTAAMAGTTGPERLDLTATWVGFTAIGVFVLAYALVMAEEYTDLRKSQPVLLAAGIIWALVAGVYAAGDIPDMAQTALRHNLLDYAELMLFLLVAMTYINAMEERLLFAALRSWLIRRAFSLRTLFCLTGLLAFFISPIADNLTTALLMCAVVMAVGGDNRRFTNLACINIVVAANAGGAFSPFGDLTTLMVWQKGIIEFTEFFALFIPSVVNYLVPAMLMFPLVPSGAPSAEDDFRVLKRGALRIVALFLITIAMAVSAHSYLHLPPVVGMMTGLGLLQLFGFYLSKTHQRSLNNKAEQHPTDAERDARIGDVVAFDVFRQIARAEWDTLLFFYGVVLCVGGLGFIGYLGMLSELMYTQWDPTLANIAVGVLSAIVDNIPVMFAVLTMLPDMSHGQWLLVTLTTGVGGSLLSIGSAAGVALMGAARGRYTFMGHLKWAPVIALGYAASILCHLWLNADVL